MSHTAAEATIRRRFINSLFVTGLLAELYDANGVDDAILRRRGESPLRQQLANEFCRLRMRDRRLHAHADQTLRVIEHLEPVSGDRRRRIARVAAALVA